LSGKFDGMRDNWDFRVHMCKRILGFYPELDAPLGDTLFVARCQSGGDGIVCFDMQYIFGNSVESIGA